MCLFCIGFVVFFVGREVSRVSILDSHCVWMLDMVQSDFADLTIFDTNKSLRFSSSFFFEAGFASTNKAISTQQFFLTVFHRHMLFDVAARDLVSRLDGCKCVHEECLSFKCIDCVWDATMG